LGAAHFRHPHVENHDVRLEFLEQEGCFVSVAGRLNSIAPFEQYKDDCVAEIVGIFSYQDFCCGC
jgi:hypothetical protein